MKGTEFLRFVKGSVSNAFRSLETFEEDVEEEKISLSRIHLQVNTKYVLVWVSAMISERS